MMVVYFLGIKMKKMFILTEVLRDFTQVEIFSSLAFKGKLALHVSIKALAERISKKLLTIQR